MNSIIEGWRPLGDFMHENGENRDSDDSGRYESAPDVSMSNEAGNEVEQEEMNNFYGYMPGGYNREYYPDDAEIRPVIDMMDELEAGEFAYLRMGGLKE